jgi:hypothetical protein
MKPRWVVILAASLLLTFAGPRAARADAIISLDTSAFAGELFSLAFSLTNGAEEVSANVPTTITLSEFAFGGGMPSGDPEFLGGASGDVAGSITLTDSEFLSFASQGFIAESLLSFRLSTTTTVEPGTPDLFAFHLIDSFGELFPTSDPTGANALFVINFDSATPDFQNYGVRVTEVPDVTTVPEPGTLLLMGIGLASMAARTRARQGSRRSTS